VDHAAGSGLNGAPLDCVVWFDGRVGCRGANILGSVGLPERAVGGCERFGVAYPCAEDFVVVPGVDGATSVGVGQGFACALTGSGVYCWGTSESGRTGAGIDPAATPVRVPPTLVAGLTDPQQLTVGVDAACVTQTGLAPACWGAGLVLGDGVGVDSAVPRALDTTALMGAGVTLALGSRLGCGSSTAGTYCWGSFDWETSFALPDARPSPERLADASVFSPGNASENLIVVTGTEARYWGIDSIFGPIILPDHMHRDQSIPEVEPVALQEVVSNGDRACFRYPGRVIECFEPGDRQFQVTF